VERRDLTHDAQARGRDLPGLVSCTHPRWWLAMFADERALLREALAGLRADDSPLRAQLLIRLAMAEAGVGGSGDEHERLCRDATSMARRLGDEELLASVLDATRHVLWEPGDVDRQLATAREILRHAQSANVPELEIQARQWLVRDHLQVGDVTSAEREMYRHARLARALRVPRHCWHALHWRALRAYLAGHLEDAERLLHRALHVGRRFDPERARLHFYAGLFVLRRDQGRCAELVDGARRLILRERLPWKFRAGFALLFAEVAHLDLARAGLTAVIAEGVTRIPHRPGRVGALCALAETSCALPDAPAAAELYRALLPYEGRNLILGDAPIFQGSISRHLGRLAAALGRGSDAETHLQRALLMHVRLRALPLQARTRLDLGAAFAQRGRPGDRARATVQLAESNVLAGALGIHGVRRRTTELLASLGGVAETARSAAARERQLP